MKIAASSIIREPDDRMADVRVSLGCTHIGQKWDEHGVYFVFRGDPQVTVELLEAAVELARERLPAGHYEDRRGRPQG